jgi:ubiquinone/menaquinone biosynthesis C-methylase UbiE
MQADEMSLTGTCEGEVLPEVEVLARYLKLQAKRVLELGCGQAGKTRELARRFAPASWLATDVNAELLERNRQLPDLPPGVEFALGGAEELAMEEESVDVVLLFKSLHHVPLSRLDDALREIHRVLRPGGLAWVSEPVYAGAFNDILRIFHDEKAVRQAAFEAVGRAVEGGLFNLEAEVFFRGPRGYRDWQEFDEKFLSPAQAWVEISEGQLAAVREAFDRACGPEGAKFAQPHRVDLLRKPV